MVDPSQMFGQIPSASFGPSAFGQSALFGQPSADLQVNEHYLQQALQHAARMPTPQSQAQVAYWQQVVMAGRAAQAAAAAAAPQAQPIGPTAGLQLPFVAPVPPASFMTPGSATFT